MAFCQAVIDDSGNESNQQIFVLAGFVAPAENWIAFSLGWDRALKEAPIPLDDFKFTEATRLRGQFDKDDIMHLTKAGLGHVPGREATARQNLQATRQY